MNIRLLFSAPLALAAFLIAATQGSCSPTNRPRPRPRSTAPGQAGRSSARPTLPTSTAIPTPGPGRTACLHCTGQPVGVIRPKKIYTNFELVVEWRHLRSGGNSGVFVWVPEARSRICPRAAAARHRGAGARSRLRRAVRKAKRQEGRLVHDQRRRVSGRRQDDPLSAALARRQPQLSRASS